MENSKLRRLGKEEFLFLIVICFMLVLQILEKDITPVLPQGRLLTASQQKGTAGAKTYPVDTDSLAEAMAYTIAGVNLDKRNIADAVLMRNEGTDNNQYLTGGNGDGDLVLDGEDHDKDGVTREVNYVSINGNNTVENSLWIFESGGDDKDNTFYIKSVVEGRYLHIYPASKGSIPFGTDADGYKGNYTYLGLENEPQLIYVDTVTNAAAGEVQGAILLYAYPNANSNTRYYVVLPTNDINNDFYGIPRDENSVNEMGHKGLHMIADTYGKLIAGLEGKTFFIAGVNNGSGSRNAGLMTGTTMGNGLESVGVEATIANEMVTNLPENGRGYAAWTFEAAGMSGTYYVKHNVTGQYLNINSDGTVTLSTAKQKIEAVVADLEHNTHNEAVKKNVVNLRAAGSRYYLNLNGNNASNGFISYACPSDTYVANRGNHLVLMEYDVSLLLAGDLGDKVYYVTAVNNVLGTDVEKLPAMSSTGISGGNLLVSRKASGELLDEGYVIEDFGQVDGTDDLGWVFQRTDTPGVYHIMAVNGGNAGKYLRIAKDGLRLEDTPQDIEAIFGSVDENYDYHPYSSPVCLRANVDGIYYYVNLNGNRTDSDFGSYGNADIGDGSNHLALVELQKVNVFLEKIQHLLDNLVATEDEQGNITGYTFSDAAYYGSALPDNANEGQQGAFGGKADPAFVEGYDQAVAYRKEMQMLAREIRREYEKLPVSEQRYIYSYQELDKMPWLWETMEVVPAQEVNATVQLFNYDGRVNESAGGASVELLNKGFKFYHKAQYDYYTAVNAENRHNTNNLGAGNSSSADNDITFSEKLDKNGYPVISGGIVNGTYQRVEDGSMEYLFNDTFRQAEMKNGGGLFQKDEKGYSYYFSNQNGAYYNPEKNRFDLYDTVIRPMYIHGKQPNESNDVYNFLPFNSPYEDAILDPENTIPSNTVGTDYTDVDGNTSENMANSVANTKKSAYLNERTDVWFGMTIDIEFLMPAHGKVTAPDGTEQDMIFEFYGDDDVLVYIDDRLVIDLGGTHSAEFGSINFTTGEVRDSSGKEKSLQSIFGLERETFEDFTFHSLKFFYLERGGNVSYSGIKFNLPELPEYYLAVEKELDFDDSFGEVKPEIPAEQYYTFRVIQADIHGTPIYNEAGEEQSFFKGGIEFEVWKDGSPVLKEDGSVEMGALDENGFFSVKTGYTAMFHKMLYSRANSNCHYYIVREILPENETGQYSKVESVIRTTETKNGIDSAADSSQGSMTVTMVNTATMPLGQLRIQKLAAEGTSIGAEETFEMQIQFGDEVVTGTGTEIIMYPIAIGTKYRVTGTGGSTIKEVEKEGVITLKVDEMATIDGILAGTRYSVQEIFEGTQMYIPAYTGEISDAEGNVEVPAVNGDGVSGEFGNIIEVAVTVENRSKYYTLPETGGKGKNPYILWGSICMLGTILYKYKIKKKGKEERNR